MPLSPIALLGLLLAAGLACGAAAAERIEVKAAEFTATTYLTEKEREQVRKDGILRGFGEAEYRFQVPRAGWYSFWAEAAQWASEVTLDGEFLIYTPFASGVWAPQAGAEKVLNVFLSEGRHTLRVSRPWPFGLPYLRRFFFETAKDVTDSVRLAPVKDHLAFRRGEAFAVRLSAGRLPEAYALALQIVHAETGRPVRTLAVKVPAGQGNHDQTLTLPTDAEGTFDLKVTDSEGRPVDRVLQYLVVDTKARPAVAEQKRELLATIHCATQTPDYAAGETRVVQAPCGTYRESGPRGRVEDLENADWFAYTLHLPSIQEPYLVEVDYPDDDQRTFLISVVEEAINPYAPTLGVACGGEFPLSRKMQTHQVVFYPRQKDPRLFLQTWYRGQRAAAGEIRVYRLSYGVRPSSSGPLASDGSVRSDRSDGAAEAKRSAGSASPARRFGYYQEEPLRFTSYWGAMPEGNTFANIYRAADRAGQWAHHLGVNLWHPTIAVYQSMMWPGKSIPGYGPSDSDGYGVLGPPTLKEPFRKDLVRLMLLASEKYGLDFVGELHVPANWVLMRALDARFGGKGTFEDDGPQKPWLIVARDGTVGKGVPRYNPIHPAVQEWVASVLSELGERYKDSPAFQGVALRLMGWQFSSWQVLPSIHWGYEDYTVALFEKESGVKVPVAADDPQRFARRYEWLLANAYEPWVSWRCRKIHEYHQRLAAVLARSRPDLSLHLDLYGPNYDDTFCRAISPSEYEEKGWAGILRESGLDPTLYHKDRRIVLNETRAYPPAMRTKEPVQAAVDRTLFYDPRLVEGLARSEGAGTVAAVHFDAQSMEGEMVRSEQLGLPKKMLLQGKETAHGAGVINPAGRHYLSRFADAMADGNITFLHDGSHGYAQGQPQYLREFLAEYRALPAIGMARLQGSGDPVALWSGRQGNQTLFYLVNRAFYPVTAHVSFGERPAVRRLSTGQPVPLDKAGRMAVALEPYQLRAFAAVGAGRPTKGGAAGGPAGAASKGGAVGGPVGPVGPVRPVGRAGWALSTACPQEETRRLEAQVEFAAQLLAGGGAAGGTTLVPFSLVDQQRAEEQLAQARRDLAAGRLVGARRALMHVRLVKVYEAFGAYPPGLFHRKAPPAPEKALGPEALLQRAADAGDARVLPAEKVAPDLAGERVLSWKERPLSVGVDVAEPNRFRLSAAYLRRAPYARPVFRLDSRDLPGQDAGPAQEEGAWGRVTILSPLPLAQGAHRLEVFPSGAAPAGLFYVHLDPVNRVLPPRDWMVIGPFDSEFAGHGGPGPGMAKRFPPEQERDFAASYPGAGGQPVSWFRPKEEGDYVNLHALTGAFQWRVSYAVTTIESPEDRPAELRFGVDYWARILLNGEKVFEVTDGHGPPVQAQYAVPVRLKRGKNELLLKIHAGSAGNGFWLSLTDPGDLRVGPPA